MNVEINGNKNHLPSSYIFNLQDKYSQTYYNLTKNIKYYFILISSTIFTDSKNKNRYEFIIIFNN